MPLDAAPNGSLELSADPKLMSQSPVGGREGGLITRPFDWTDHPTQFTVVR